VEEIREAAAPPPISNALPADWRRITNLSDNEGVGRTYGHSIRLFKNYGSLSLRRCVGCYQSVFSLLDPLIFRHIIDSYATRYREYSANSFCGASAFCSPQRSAWRCLASRQELSGLLRQCDHSAGRRAPYSDGIRHSLELPYTLFEDQRSGETLSRLQKVRTDVEKLIALAVNLAFTR